LPRACNRADLGVGTVWSPAVGEGIRPSSVLALNVASLATADVEMQALHQANKRTKTPAHHEVFAFGNDIDRRGPGMTSIPDLTDDRALEAIRRAYEQAGLGDAAMVMAVHRDTFDDDTGKRLLHVHVARSGINPKTLRAYDHQRINTRMDRAARAVEMEMGLFHDRGLAVVDYTEDGKKFIRDSTVPERIAWRREIREDRLIALERARYIDNALRAWERSSKSTPPAACSCATSPLLGCANGSTRRSSKPRPTPRTPRASCAMSSSKRCGSSTARSSRPKPGGCSPKARSHR
jgi:hypothetical protein